MKKSLLIIASVVILASLLSCRSSSNAPGTSLVTITVGHNTTVQLSIRQATFFAKLKSFLAEHIKIKVNTASAAVPLNVVSISVTVEADDLATITQTVNVTGLTATSITIEVPNGLGREFIVAGFDINGAYAFWGHAFADLSGAPVTLPVEMFNLGAVINIVWVSVNADTRLMDGTREHPYRTISGALSITKNNEAIFVGAGTYDAAGGESFPFQLKVGTALIGLGQNHSTEINAYGTVQDVIYGNVDAHIAGFKIIPECDNTGIDDSIGGVGVGLPAITFINNVTIDEGAPFCGPLNNVILSTDSSVTNSTLKNSTWHGIDVVSGNPIIKNNTLTGHTEDILVESGIPVISFNRITNSAIGTTGISVTGGSPLISNNTIDQNDTGISVIGGSPSISSNTINGNGTGVSVITSVGVPTVKFNKIYCNSIRDLYAATLTPLDALNNSWDHDSSTIPSGPAPEDASLGPCSAGSDICYTPPLPLVTSIGAAVPGGCL